VFQFRDWPHLQVPRQLAPKGPRRVRHPLARDDHDEAERGFDLVQELLAEPIDHGLVFRHVFVAVEDYEQGLAEGSQVLAQQVSLVRALLGEVR